MKKRVVIEDYEESLERDVKKLANGAYVPVPKKHIGKGATIIIH